MPFGYCASFCSSAGIDVSRATHDEPRWYATVEFQLYRKGFAGPELTSAIRKANSQCDGARWL